MDPFRSDYWERFLFALLALGTHIGIALAVSGFIGVASCPGSSRRSR